MGKKGGGNSWLTVVKRAFRSPTKDSKKKSCRRRDEFDCVPEEEEEKKRGKKRWLFRKTSTNNNNNNNNNGSPYNCAPETPPQSNVKAMKKSSPAQQKRHAAVEINIPTSAATTIQTAFRAYVARRAFGALKGIVKLQALIRGQNVRKQAKMTLKCMQALLRVQARLRDQQARLLSHDVDHDGGGGGGRKSMFAECNNLWESRYLGEVRERKSMSTKNRSSIAEEYYCPRTLEDLQAALQLQATKEAAALKRERKSLASAFSLHHHHPTWDNDYDINCGYEKEGEEEERTKWLDKWMATKQWDNCNYTRIGSTDNYNKRDHHSSIKTVEMVESPIPNQYQYQYQRPTTPNNNYRSFCNNYYSSPSPSKNRLLPGQHVRRSSSPRRTPNKEEKSYYYSTAANTPTSTGSMRSSLQRLHGNNNSLGRRYSVSTNNEGRTGFNANDVSGLMVPSYMAATESAKARVRSQSAPRQRPSTPERDYQQRGSGGGGLAKKRLSFPVPPTTTAATGIINHQNLRSPSFKSLQAGYVGMEQQSNQSCYSTTDSFGGGQISPCSTTDMRRWLR